MEGGGRWGGIDEEVTGRGERRLRTVASAADGSGPWRAALRWGGVDEEAPGRGERWLWVRL
jgi:hypothetical protein